MASILPFVSRGLFDDVATKAMGEAFDAACKTLYETARPEKVVQEAIARRIVSNAGKGHRDVKKLRDAALAGLARTNPAAGE